MSGRRRGQATQARRVLALRDLLSGRRALVSAAALAEQLGVSERQLRRDLTALESAGYPLERTLLDGRSAVRLEGGPRTVPLTRRERYSLLAARGTLSIVDGTSFSEDLDSACLKLGAGATAAERAELATLARAFTFVPDGGVKAAPDPDVLDALLTGALDRRLVDAEYQPPRRQAFPTRLAPYALALHRNGLYVVGRVEPDDGLIRTWAAERFRSASFVRGTRFSVPGSFDVSSHFATGVGLFTGSGSEPTEVVVDFAHDVAMLLEARTWHPTQRVEPIPTGVRLRLDVSDWTPLVPWILSWGWHASPRAPRALVKRIRTEHRAALRALEQGRTRGGV